MECVLQVVLKQALPSLGQTENYVRKLQILVTVYKIACLEFTIHMQTLTLAMFYKAGTVLVLIGAACDRL